MSSCLAVMDNFLQQPHPVLASTVIAEKGRGASDGNQISLTDAVANILGNITFFVYECNMHLF